MNRLQFLARKSAVLFSMMLLFGLVSGSMAFAQSDDAGVPAPTGFNHMLVYMADGVYDPNDADYTAPDGDYFLQEVMGRSETEIADHRQAAIDFFQERFGVDVVNDERVEFTSFMVDPRNEYRLYVKANTDVPSEGWVVRDGGWRMSVTDPEGITLGGEFDGVQVPQGSFGVFGEYNIDVASGSDSPFAVQPQEIIIHYQSGSLIEPGSDGIMFRCELFYGDYDDVDAPRGLAQGISAPQTTEDGLTQANIRNVLTFPGLGQ